MTSRTFRRRSQLLIADPHDLMDVGLRAAIVSSSHWSIASSRSRRPPTIAMLVTSADEQPSMIIQHFYTHIAAIPTVVYDTAPTMSRQANAFISGANGYIIPDITLDDLIPVLALAQTGGFSTCAGTLRMMREQMRAPLDFSKLEQEVVALFSLGADLRSIGEELHISDHNVEEALKRACQKVGVSSPVALVSWWTRWIVMDDPAFDYEGSAEDHRYVLSA